MMSNEDHYGSLLTVAKVPMKSGSKRNIQIFRSPGLSLMTGDDLLLFIFIYYLIII